MTKREYNTIHVYNLRNFIKTGVCEHCKESIKTQWANKTGQYLKGVRDDWLELCRKCHDIYDLKVFGKRIGGPGAPKGSRGGFAANKDRAVSAGRKGGLISKRGKSKV